jgi:hypothetical protein
MADRETIIDSGGDGSGNFGAGMLMTAVIVILLLIAGGYLVFNHGGPSSSVTLNLPKVTVTAPKT